MTRAVEANIERFSGFADVYDAYRPQPPAVIVDLLTQLAGIERPRLVVDLGAGTGLSTRIWAEKADEVVGIEPNADMRAQAEAAGVGGTGVPPVPIAGETPAPPEAASGWKPDLRVGYAEGTSDSTGLPSECADIVTASQALHWMEPNSTLAEVGRILRPGGVFAAIDCDWPPVMRWEAEAAYTEFALRHRYLQVEQGIEDTIARWPKDGHLGRIKASGRFRYVRESVLHSVERGNAARLVGLALSQGGVRELLKRGVTEEELGLKQLREAAERYLGDELRTWYFCYRVRVGIK